MNEKNGNPFGFCQKFARFELYACSCGFETTAGLGIQELSRFHHAIIRRQRFALAPRRKDKKTLTTALVLLASCRMQAQRMHLMLPLLPVAHKIFPALAGSMMFSVKDMKGPSGVSPQLLDIDNPTATQTDSKPICWATPSTLMKGLAGSGKVCNREHEQ